MYQIYNIYLLVYTYLVTQYANVLGLIHIVKCVIITTIQLMN
jgi:hypothetical protein